MDIVDSNTKKYGGIKLGQLRMLTKYLRMNAFKFNIVHIYMGSYALWDTHA